MGTSEPLPNTGEQCSQAHQRQRTEGCRIPSLGRNDLGNAVLLRDGSDFVDVVDRVSLKVFNRREERRGERDVQSSVGGTAPVELGVLYCVLQQALFRRCGGMIVGGPSAPPLAGSERRSTHVNHPTRQRIAMCQFHTKQEQPKFDLCMSPPTSDTVKGVFVKEVKTPPVVRR